jgi:hypothetical protein
MRRRRGARHAVSPEAIYDWMDRPLSTLSCVTGWCAATILFFGLVAFLGGISQADT